MPYNECVSERQPRITRIHPELPIEWHCRDVFRGTLYYEPGTSAEQLLEWAGQAPTHVLANTLPELGSGTRGIVLHGGDLAIKRCVNGNYPHITGQEAVAASVALATALRQKCYTIGDYRLLSSMPRGYFEPSSLAGQPTWGTDIAPGESAQAMVSIPKEAGPLARPQRDALCRLALESCGVDPCSVFLDSEEPGNLMVDTANRILTVVDVSAVWNPLLVTME